MPVVIEDIIRVPERTVHNITLDVNKQINYWKLYEQTFKRKDQKIKIEKSNLSINLISDFLEYIENIKFNFYCNENDIFEYKVLKTFISEINIVEKDNILQINQDVFNLDKKNLNIIKMYFTCIDKMISIEKSINKKEESVFVFDKYMINNLTDSICELIDKVDVSKVETIIKINLQLDKYLNHVPDSFKQYLINEIFNRSFCSKLIECFELDFDKMIKILQQWKTISEKIISSSSSKITECLLNHINYEHTQDDYTNSNLAKKTFYIYGLINKFKNDDVIDFNQENTEKNYSDYCRVIYNETNVKNENFLKYLFASIYEIMKDNSNQILEFIRFQKYNVNSIDFINYYKVYLQKRLLNGSNVEKESIFYKEIQNNFKDEEIIKLIEVIDNCIKDFKISSHINDEVRGLSVVVKNPLFKNVKLDLYKIKLSILSSVLWNNFMQPQKSYKINIPNNIKIYTSLIEKYYDKKYENRSIHISHEESVITIMLRKLKLKLPLSNYYLLKFIANKDNFENITEDENKIKYISTHLNMPSDEVENKTNLFLSIGLIENSDIGYKVNSEMCNQKNTIDMTKKMVLKEPEHIEENEFCKEELIDCFLIKIVKKEPVSYGKYLYLLRSNLKNLFIPNDKMIKSRIDRMLKLEYLDFRDEKYHYIP